jgi:hypothetical protein
LFSFTYSFIHAGNIYVTGKSHEGKTSSDKRQRDSSVLFPIILR